MSWGNDDLSIDYLPWAKFSLDQDSCTAVYRGLCIVTCYIILWWIIWCLQYLVLCNKHLQTIQYQVSIYWANRSMKLPLINLPWEVVSHQPNRHCCANFETSRAGLILVRSTQKTSWNTGIYIYIYIHKQWYIQRLKSYKWVHTCDYDEIYSYWQSNDVKAIHIY